VWMLRTRGEACTLKLAARPIQARVGNDDLHAWVEVGGGAILGALPGPWIVVMTLTS
jgi:transglutaminase-like putative cysteine protease